MRRGSWALALLALACSSGQPTPDGPPPPTKIDAGCPEPPVEVCFVHLEAEDFSGPWNTQRNIAPFYGRGFLTSNAFGVADSEMRAEVTLQSGRYVVWSRAFRDPAARDWRVVVAGSTLAATHGSFSGPAGFDWVRAGEVDVEGGATPVTIQDVGSGFEAVDAIVMSSDLNFDPYADEDEWRILPRADGLSMMRDAVLDRSARVRNSIPVPATLAEWEARRDDVRARVRQSMGLATLPERTPLNAEVIRTIPRDGYRIELVRFESRPNFVVTAHVYVPDGPGPFPVVVNPIGHYYALGKSDHNVTPRAHGLAQLGYIALVYDAFGHGERDTAGMTHEEGWKLALTGRANVTLMVWDTMRAIDYLATRSDVDATRVAVTGASGGGLNTLYTSVVEDRVTAAIPTVYMTEFEELFAANQPHDACTYQWGIAGFTEMAEIAALSAPKPKLFNAGRFDDLFPYEGTLRARDSAARIYDLYGAGDDVRVFVDEVGHAYSQPMRERLYGFVDKHLKGRGDGAPVAEPSFVFAAQDDPQYRIHDSGYIAPDTDNVRSLADKWAREAVATLPAGPQISTTAMRTALQATLLTHPDPTEPEVVVLDSHRTTSGVEIQRLRFDVEPGIAIPAYFAPGPPGAPVIVMIDGGGLTRPEVVADAASLGVSLVYVEPRGRGETAWNEHLATGENFMFGDSLLGLRAQDLAKVRRALRSFDPVLNAPVGLLALSEEAALTALYSQAMYFEYDAVALGPVMSTFMEVFIRAPPLATRVFGILRVGDVPHAAWVAGERPLRIVFATDHYTQFYDWDDKLRERVTVESDLTRESGIAWLVSQLP